MIKRTRNQENTKKLRKTYKEELSKKTARLLIEKSDGTFEILTGISHDVLEETIKKTLGIYGEGSVGLLYRRDTYAFLGENCICRPSSQRSEEDYISLALPERKEILRERVIKTLFNGNS